MKSESLMLKYVVIKVKEVTIIGAESCVKKAKTKIQELIKSAKEKKGKRDNMKEDTQSKKKKRREFWGSGCLHKSSLCVNIYLNFVTTNTHTINVMFNERKNKSCRNKIFKSLESLFKNVHVLSYENANNPKRILKNNTCNYYNRQSLPEYKNKKYEKLYNLNP